jgi:molybdopterin converting factor small subunit
VSVEGATVAQVLASLDAADPGFSEKLLSDDGSLVRYVNVFVDDDDVRFMEGLDTVVPDGVTVSIMQAVAGGA